MAPDWRTAHAPSGWMGRRLADAVAFPSGQVDPRLEPYRSMTLVAPDHVDSGSGRLLARVTAGEQGAISGKYLFQPGDIIYSKIRPYLRKVIRADFPGLSSADMYPLRAAEGLDSRFLLHLLLSEHFSRFAEIVSMRSGFPKINRVEFREYTASLPPLPEQRRIAEILDTIDEAIRKTEEIITKLEQVKQGLLHDLLTRGIDDNGELRDPDRHPDQFKPSPLGRIPVAWDIRRFGDLCESSAFGPRFSAAYYDPGGRLATLRTTDMDDEGNIQLGTMPRADIDPAAFATHLLRHEDLVISRSGTCGIAGVFPGHSIAVVPGAFLIRFRLKQTSHAHFYRRYLNSTLGRPRLARLAVGGVQKNLKGSSVLDLAVPLAPLHEVDRIRERIAAAEATALEEREGLAKLRLMKLGLMDDLLTGRVRVTSLLKEAAE